MATKPTKRNEIPQPRKAIPCQSSKDPDEAGRKFAGIVTSSAVAAHRVIVGSEQKGVVDGIDAPGMLALLREQAAAVNRGDLSQAEAMLMNQATALQSLFVRLTERGMDQSMMPNIEGFMRLALRAQSQCRATLETLAAIKNPPIVYARQANVTTGPQQINNGTAATSPGREIENEQTQLSGGTHELLPDARTSGDASRVDPALETVGEIDRAKIARG